MGNYKTTNIPIFFSIGILLNCLFFTTTLLDYTLVPRFIFLSLFTLTFFIVILFICKKEVTVGIDLYIFPLFSLTIFSAISIIWALNISLAIIEASKTILYFIVLVITYKLLHIYRRKFLFIFLKIVLILFYISTFKALIQLLELPDFSHFNLYGITGISGHKNLYSSFIFLCSVFTFISLLYLKSYWRMVAFLAVICQIILIALLQTRAVWIGYAVFIFGGLIIYLAHKRSKKMNIRTAIVTLITSMVLINVFFIYALPRLLSIYISKMPVEYNSEQVSDLATMTERTMIWEKTYEFFFDHKWIGVGANNWQIYFPASSLPNVYRITDLNVTFQRPHNDFLWILSEYGIIGFNLFIGFIIILLLFLFLRINSKDIIHVIVFSGILGFLTISFFDFPKERIEHNILFSSLLGLAYYLIKKEKSILDIELFSVQKFALKIFIIPLIAIFYFGILNFKGEYFTKKMYVERSKKNNKEVIYYANSALSFCYTTDPTSFPLSWFKGNANVNLGNYAAALADFKNAYRVHPFNHHVLNDLGSSYFLNNQVDSAKYFYVKSSKINPRFDDPKLNLTAIYINEGNYKEARKWNESILHDSKRRSYYTNLINEHQ